MSDITIQAWNFRVLNHLSWSPRGVCLLSGPNGSGKTTVLDVLIFLRELFERGHEAALQAVDSEYLKRIDSPQNEPVVLQVEVGDIRWKLRLMMGSNGLQGTYGEELYRGSDIILRAAMGQEDFYWGAQQRFRDETRCCAKWLWDRGETPWMKPLSDMLSGIRVYKSYSLQEVQRYERIDTLSASLSQNGKNLWSVLANWKSSPIRYQGQYEWVMAKAKKAFPGLISTIEFDRGFPFIYRPGAMEADQGLPPRCMADGLLTGLLHLTAVAGAAPGSLIAFDEMENQLHPYAIRLLIEAMREKAEEKDLGIILTTHSPIVMNTFRDEPENVYVFESATPGGAVPTAITDLHSEEWLTHAKLGTLYDRLEFSAPVMDEKMP